MNANQRIAFNSVVIFVRLCIVTVVSLFASRLVLNALGVSDYGLYNVVGGIVMVLNVVNTAMVSTTYRYLSFEIGKKSEGNPNKIFNTSFIIHLCFAVLILILGFTVGFWYIDTYLNVAVDKLPDARFVFVMSVITTSISTLFVPFQGLQVAYEKFAINASIDIVSQLIRIGGIILFLDGNHGNGIRIYAIIMMITNVSAALLYYAYCAKNYWGVIKPKKYRDMALVKDMMSFASWTSVGAFANVGKVQGSAIVINLFFGTVVNAAYAVANQVENFILMFARTLNNAAIPQITKSFSSGDRGRSIKLTAYISKYTFLLMSLVAFPVLLEMDFLLHIWLGTVPEGATIFCQIMILSGLLGCLGEGIPAMINATGSIKGYQLVVNVILLLGLPISYVCYLLGANCYSLVIVYCVISGVSGFIKLYMLRRVVDFDVKMFFDVSYNKILYVSIPLIIYYFFYDSTSYSTLGHVCGFIFSELFLLMSIAVFGLDKNERRIVVEYVHKACRKIIRK